MWQNLVELVLAMNPTRVVLCQRKVKVMEVSMQEKRLEFKWKGYVLNDMVAEFCSGSIFYYI